MKKLLSKQTIIIAMILTALTVYAQSPWRSPIRSPEDVRGMRDELDTLKLRVDVLEARETILSDALLDLYYDKQLSLASARRNAADAGEGWGPFIMDPASPGGEVWILGTTYITELDDEQIPDVDAHITALETP